ncbi:glutathione S-transferase family protein [Ectothiorhodospiraceae bacterium WFHF3C12]|nr:glutathione S-transferase family protein [Ectothiorhodospiraceae bacterium WFHF3C12]
MYKLHFHPVSNYSRRVTMALAEKGIDYEPVTVDMPNGAHKSPEYLALNPYGRVPTLVEGDFVLYESTAILNYLETRHPEPALAPADARERARMDMHMKLCDLQLTNWAGRVLFPKRFLPEERWDRDAMQKASEEIGKHLEIVARELGNNDYLVGNRFSLADICYTPTLEFLYLIDTEVPEAINAWAERLLARPSAQQTKPAM